MPIPAKQALDMEDAIDSGRSKVSNEDLLTELGKNAMRPKEVEALLDIKGGAAGARLKRLLEQGFVRKIRLDQPGHEEHGKIFWVAEPDAAEKFTASKIKE